MNGSKDAPSGVRTLEREWAIKKEGSQDLLKLKNPSWSRKSTKVNQQDSNVNLKKWHERWKVYKMKMVNEFLYYGDFLAASQIASFLVDFFDNEKADF